MRLEGDTLWLSQKQIAEVFGTERPAITKHLANIFSSGELVESAVCSILEHTAPDHKTYKTKHYNLDAILSVGYRVNSARATRFRQWATEQLKEHLIRGYSLNEQRLRLQEGNLRQLEQALTLFQQNLIEQANLPEARGLVRVIADYARTFVLLHQFDSERLPQEGFAPVYFELGLAQAKDAIAALTADLMSQGEASRLSGTPRMRALRGSLALSGNPLGASYSTQASRRSGGRSSVARNGTPHPDGSHATRGISYEPIRMKTQHS